MAREHGPAGYHGGRPEDPYYEVRPQPPSGARAARIGAVAGLLAVAALGAAAALASSRGRGEEHIRRRA